MRSAVGVMTHYPRRTHMGECQSCGAEVKREGHYLCYNCWNEKNDSGFNKSNNSDSIFTATKLGQEFEISGQKMNLLLNELESVGNRNHRG